MWLWLQEGGEMVLAFLFTWFVVQRLGAAGYGLVVLVQTVVDVAGLGALNLELALIRFLPEFRSQGHNQTVRETTWLIVAAKAGLAFLAAASLYLLASWVATYYEQAHLVTAIQFGCLSLFSAALVTTGKAFCLGWLRPDVRALLSFLRRIIELAGLLLVMNLAGLTVTRVVAVLAVADTVTAVAFLLFIAYSLWREPAAAGDTMHLLAQTNRIVRYCLPLIGVQFTEVASQKGVKLLLGRLAPPEVLGLYGIARQAIDRLMLLMSQLPLMAVPVLAQKRGERSEERGERSVERGEKREERGAWREERGALGDSEEEVQGLAGRLLRYQWGLGAMANLAVWAAAPVLLLVLGEGDVTPVEPALRILGWSVLLWAGAGVMHVFFFIYERTAGILVLNLGQLALTALLYLVMVPRWQATGAALADVMAQALELGLGLWLVNRWFGFPLARVVPFLLKAGGVLGLLMLPVWLWPAAGYGFLALWAVAAVGVFGSYLLYMDVPAATDWQLVNKRNWGHPLLNRAAAGLARAVGRYQAGLQRL